MEFTVNKQNITTGLYKALGVVDKKSNLNILSHVLVESVSSNQIRLTCTDYDVVLTGTYAADVTQPGSMAVGGKALYEVVRALPDEPIHFNRLENHWVELTCGTSQFRLAGLPTDDFPQQTQPENLSYMSIPKDLLLNMIDRTLFSVSHDESRPSLNGTLLDIKAEGDELRLLMVSTDGHRLSKTEALGGEVGDFSGTARTIVHHKAISELKRCLEGDDENLRIAFHRGNVYFGNDEVLLQVRELDEAFPDYARVIPQSNQVQLTLQKDQFQSAIRRIATLTSAKTHIVKFELENSRLVLTSSNPEAGEGRDELAVEYDGEKLVFGFNYRYVLDVLSVINGENVTFSINDQYSPGLITSSDDEGSLFVIMPMRI